MVCCHVELTVLGVEGLQDAYVLARVFKKSGPGPKNGEQYGGAFIEEAYRSPPQEDTVVEFPVEQSGSLPEPAVVLEPLPAVKTELSEGASVHSPAAVIPEGPDKMLEYEVQRPIILQCRQLQRYYFLGLYVVLYFPSLLVFPQELICVSFLQMMNEYLKGETVGSKMIYPLTNEWEVHIPHDDDMGLLQDFGEVPGLDDEALLLQDMLEIAETGDQGVHVERDVREDFIDQFFSSGVVEEDLALGGSEGEFSLADIEGHGPPLLSGGDELTPWEIAEGDYIELNDFLFPNDTTPSWSQEYAIQLQERHSDNFPIQQSEQGRARRRSMLQIRGSGSGPVQRSITVEYNLSGAQTLPAMSVLELTGTSDSTTQASRPDDQQHEQRIAEGLTASQHPSFQSEHEVSLARSW